MSEQHKTQVTRAVRCQCAECVAWDAETEHVVARAWLYMNLCYAYRIGVTIDEADDAWCGLT